jgi:hypothetical protein
VRSSKSAPTLVRALLALSLGDYMRTLRRGEQNGRLARAGHSARGRCQLSHHILVVRLLGNSY